MLNTLFSLSRLYKNSFLLIVDFMLFVVALLCAFWLRYNEVPDLALTYVWIFPATGLIGVICLSVLSVYSTIVRYASTPLLIRIAVACVLGAMALSSVIYMFRVTSMARSLPVLWAILSFLFICGFRYAIRLFFVEGVAHKDKLNVIVYGAGDTGVSVAKAIMGSEYKPVAFIDKSKKLQGKIIHGVRVYAPDQLTDLLEKTGCKNILLAIPSMEKSEKKSLLQGLTAHAVRVKTVPSVNRIINGLTIADLPDVEIEDLLGRDAVAPIVELLQKNTHQRVVLVTGAGGSIGSEICRQVVMARPKKIILVEHSEFLLYQIHANLKQLIHAQVSEDNANNYGLKSITLVPLLADVKDQKTLSDAFTAHAVQTVYHAAAYKHVPMVEANVVNGVANNALGTIHCAEAAVDAGVETFVLISTDKAVRPTNVMGASKRLAEIFLQDLSEKSAKTIIAMVRFGNVLGSSGSVVPLFKRQIKAGGPVTVTDPEMTRYFMTIPEATQLVIQAGALAEGGEVFLLEMGESVKIVDLARNMIHLMGYEVGGFLGAAGTSETAGTSTADSTSGTIAIEFVGIRPGEKLYEELLVNGQATPTRHSQIMKTVESYQKARVTEWRENLEQAFVERDEMQIIAILEAAVEGFVREKKLSTAQVAQWQTSES